MKLFTDELPDIENVTAEQLEYICTVDTYGDFLVLLKTDSEFMQACWHKDATPGAGFIPYRLEYRDGPESPILVARGLLTIEQVTEALLDYLEGNREWLSRFEWEEVEL